MIKKNNKKPTKQKTPTFCWMWHFLEELTAILVYKHELKKKNTFKFYMKGPNYLWKKLSSFNWKNN